MFVAKYTVKGHVVAAKCSCGGCGPLCPLTLVFVAMKCVMIGMCSNGKCYMAIRTAPYGGEVTLSSATS